MLILRDLPLFQQIKKDLKKYSKIFEQKDRLSQSKASKVSPVPRHEGSAQIVLSPHSREASTRPGDRPQGWIRPREGVVEGLPEEAEGKQTTPGAPALQPLVDPTLSCLSGWAPLTVFHFHLLEQSEGSGVRQVLVL